MGSHPGITLSTGEIPLWSGDTSEYTVGLSSRNKESVVESSSSSLREEGQDSLWVLVDDPAPLRRPRSKLSETWWTGTENEYERVRGTWIENGEDKRSNTSGLEYQSVMVQVLPFESNVSVDYMV